MTVEVTARRVARWLAGTLTTIVLLHLLARLVRILAGGQLWSLTALFDLDEELNLPTWYASLLHLFVAAALGVIYREERKRGSSHAASWRLLAAVFLVLSIDESASLHERVINPMRRAGFSGWLYHSWMVLAIPAVLLLAVRLWGWFRSLPVWLQRSGAIAAGVFLSGAVGMEFPGGLVEERYGRGSMPLFVLTTIEETLEFAGVSYWLYSLLRYMEQEQYTLQVRWAGTMAPGQGSAVPTPADALYESRSRAQGA